MALKRRDQPIRGAAENVPEVPDWVPGPVSHLAHLMHKDAIKREEKAESIEHRAAAPLDVRSTHEESLERTAEAQAN
jgi:hypothetical protein